MKKILLTLTLLAAGFLGGCCCRFPAVTSPCPTVTETASERHRRYERINDIQARQLIEDWDYLWLYEKPSYLSPWYIRDGLP